MADEIVKKDDNATIKESTTTDRIFVPAVDIVESNNTIRLMVEMPGVDSDSVEVTVEKNILTIEGKAHVDEPEGYELVAQEYGVGRYRRDFTLSDDVDSNAIKAKVRNGILELVLPEKEDVKARKIAVEGE